MHECHFAPGQYIFRQGDASDVAYILTSGSVEIVAASTSGELRLAVMREGDIFGEMGVIDEAPRSASARALEPVLVAAVTRNEFVQTILSQEEQGLALLRALFERLRVANQLLLRTVGGLPDLPDTNQCSRSGGAIWLRLPVDARAAHSGHESHLAC